MTDVETMCRRAVEGLRSRDFEACYVATKEEALAAVLAEAESAETVGWGGSETLKEIGARTALAEAGKTICEYKLEMDLFLLSTNALTLDGRIVNIDGRGNRVSASIAGPKRVVYVVGANKLVDGGADEAIRRVKRSACPPNCRRLGKRTPCAGTGVCADCDSPDRICKVTAIFDRRPTGMPTKVIVVGENLGY